MQGLTQIIHLDIFTNFLARYTVSKKYISRQNSE